MASDVAAVAAVGQARAPGNTTYTVPLSVALVWELTLAANGAVTAPAAATID